MIRSNIGVNATRPIPTPGNDAPAKVPNDLWPSILEAGQFTPADLLSIRQVNRRLQVLGSSDKLWSPHLPPVPEIPGARTQSSRPAYALTTTLPGERDKETLWRLWQGHVSPDEALKVASDSRSIAYAAVQKDGGFLRFASEALQRDPELRLLALKTQVGPRGSVHTVERVENGSQVQVYIVTHPEPHTFTLKGIPLHDCGLLIETGEARDRPPIPTAIHVMGPIPRTSRRPPSALGRQLLTKGGAALSMNVVGSNGPAATIVVIHPSPEDIDLKAIDLEGFPLLLERGQVRRD